MLYNKKNGVVIMRIRKNILCLMISVVLIVNTVIANATSDNTDKKVFITLTDDINNITTDKEYDGLLTSIFCFDDSILSGVEEGDDVHLVADQTFQTKDSNNAQLQDVTLSNFHLIGDDKDKYELSVPITGPINKQAKIEPRTIEIAPNKTYLYYGQEKKEMITDVTYDEFKIVNGDIVNITADFYIQFGNNVGDYDIEARNIQCDNKNYKAEFDNTLKFRVLEYKPDIAAIGDNADGKYAGTSTAVLTAPQGFLISETNSVDDNSWSETISINLIETQTGVANYYLRNNDETDMEYYKAISEKKEYTYQSVQTKPEIVSVEIQKSDVQKILNFLGFGVFGNGSVKVIITAKGAAVMQDTAIYLGEDGSFTSKKANSELRGDIYYYTSEFEFNVPSEEEYFLSTYLKAYAENSSGIGSTVDVKFTDDKGNVMDTNYFVLDNVAPDVQIININGNYNNDSIKADVQISDSGAGVAKVEYKWDTKFRVNGEYKTDYIEYEGYIDTQTDYKFILPWEDSVQVDKGQHMLYLRVTDNAGNVCEVSKKDGVGSDRFSPQIVSVEIKKSEANISDSVLRFLTFGNFANNKVEIHVTVNDNEGDNMSYASGIDKVSLNDRIMELAKENEYVLTVSNNDILSDIQICVTDKVGLYTIKSLMEIDSTQNIKSNDLVVEDEKPIVDFNISANGHLDDEGKVWYGGNEKEDMIEIISSEQSSDKNSGLYSVKVLDNDVELFVKDDFASIQLEHKKSFVFDQFDEGHHVLKVISEDNSGNIKNDKDAEIEFYIDYTAPEKGIITPVSYEGVYVDGNLWFDKNDVVEFRVDVSDAGSGIDNILLMINGEQFVFSRNEIHKDEQGYYVLKDTLSINPDNEHKYVVTGSVTDIAGNTSTLNTLIVYKDFENPEINKFTVEKKNSGILDKVLNVLSFGVFANDTLVFKAYVSDAEFDSGVAYVTINYDGLDKPRKMVFEENGIYSVDIPVSTKIFQSHILVEVYDKYGKKSVSCPNIENAEQGKGVSNNVFVMIEDVKPVANIDKPDSDDIKRIDGQTWYNSNKRITVKAYDKDSGVRNVELTVNGIDVTTDIDNVLLPKISSTETADRRDTNEYEYVFDTNYFTSIAGEANDGKYVIIIKVTDNAGNVNIDEAEYYIDKQEPVIDRFEFSLATDSGITETSEFIQVLEYGYYFKTEFIASISVSDLGPSSGLNEITYRLVSYEDGEQQKQETGSEKIVNGKADFKIFEGFKGQIFVEAYDNTGNRSGEKTSKAFVIDSFSPDINILDNNNTNYRDGNSNQLFTSDVNFTVTISDTISGIKEIGYYQSAEKESFDRQAIILSNTGYKIGDNLGNGWIVSEMDANLVTKVVKTFSFSSDDNDIVLTFDATDRSGNKTENVHSNKFSIDKTNPIVNVVFRSANGNEEYYNTNRVADITVIERNFDQTLINTIIENTFGRVPTFMFTQESNTEYTAVIEFDEGDYTFDINGTDMAGHAAIVNFSGGNEHLFFIDKTPLIAEENFATFSNSVTENSFNTSKTVTIRVTEHNFAPDLINLKILRKNAGESHNEMGLMDVTNEMLNGVSWVSDGDVHTISFEVDKDGVYQIQMTPSDMAGNNTTYKSTEIFEIDSTPPVLLNSVDISIYTKEVKDEPSVELVFEDKNIKEVSFTITVYNFNKKSNGAYEFVPQKSVNNLVQGETVKLPEEYFGQDGIYEIRATAYDIAGNSSGEKMYTYVVMRNTAMMAYIPEEHFVRFNNIGTRAIDFADISLYVYVVDGSDFNIKIGEILLSDTDYIIMEEKEIANKIKEYKICIPQTYITNTFNENNQVYDMPINILNKNEQLITVGYMVIDNVKPFGEFEEKIKDGKGYYGVKNQDIRLIKLSDDIDENATSVNVDGEEVPFIYDSDNKTITFTLEKSKAYGLPFGGHVIRATLVDTAGNEYSLSEVNNIYVGNWFLRFWILFAIGGVIAGITIFVIWRYYRKKRS